MGNFSTIDKIQKLYKNKTQILIRVRGSNFFSARIADICDLSISIDSEKGKLVLPILSIKYEDIWEDHRYCFSKAS